MKCKYKYCKNNGETDKEHSVKIGNTYYCKECYEEKEIKQNIENYYLNNMPQCTLQILRKVIKQLIHEKQYDAEYVLFVLKYIKENNKLINNPFGLIGYCNEGRLQRQYKDIKISQEFIKIKDNIITDNENNEVVFKYKPSNKKITDLI